MKKTMKNTLMMKGLVLVLAICFIAFGGVLSVSADDDEDSVIAVGKDVTVTYSPENDGGFISFYPDNAGYQCYRISGEVEKGSNSQIKVYAAACHGGQQESFGTDEELSMSNPKSSFWTTSLKKEDGYDNGIEVWTNIGYRDLEGSVTVKWHIEKLIGLNDTNSDIKVTLSGRDFVIKDSEDLPKPKVDSVKVDGKELTLGVDYQMADFSYYWDTQNHVGSVFIEGIGNYGDIREEEFRWTVVQFSDNSSGSSKEGSGNNSTDNSADKTVEKPAGTSIKKLTAARKGFKATWKKQAKETNGYEIQYSLKKSMKSAKTVQIKKTGTVSKKISKLKAKKKYYVRIRTYKTVNKTNYYSDWSKIKTVKTK